MKYNLIILAILSTSILCAQINKHNDDDNRTIKIPVVFHAVKKKAIDKMTYQMAEKIIQQLNTNYSATNDMSLLNSDYKDLVGSPNISFYLAEHGVQANGDQGIIRHKGIFIRKYKNSIGNGGLLNIFVGNFGTASDMLSQNSNSRLLKINYQIIDDGSSLTHEVGHWLGLWHVWGPGNCGYKRNEYISDEIPDTLEQKTCTDKSRRECTPLRPNSNNFMDYSNCRMAFTKDQAQMIRNNLILYKRSIFDNSM